MAFLEKILIGLAIFVVLLGGKKVAAYFLENEWAVFAVSLFALFNPFVYDRLLYGQIGIVLSLGFFLLAAAHLLQYLDDRQRKNIILFGVFTAFAVQFSPHFIFFIGTFFIFFLVLYFRRWKSDGWKIFVGSLLIAGFICVVLNVNWLIAGVYSPNNAYEFISSNINSQDLVAFKTSGTSGAQVLSNVVMMSGFWGKDQQRYADLTTMSDNWGRSFIILLPLVLLGLVCGIRKKETRLMSVGLLVLFIVSVLLASGIALSFAAPLSYWLFDHFPLYKSLRESQKWVSVIVLVYVIFLSLGTSVLMKTKVGLVHKNTILVFLLAIIVMQTPLLFWGYAGQAGPVQYPSDWTEVDHGMECSGSDMALFLPWHMYMSFNWIGKIVLNPAADFFTCPIVSSQDMEWDGTHNNKPSISGPGEYSWLHSSKGLSSIDSKIKYVILAKELDWNDYSWLNDLSGMKLIKETETLKIYERQ